MESPKESIKKTSKSTRKSSKSTRKTSKSTRKPSKSARKTSKSTRKSSKSTRKPSKSTRKSSKSTRKSSKTVDPDKEKQIMLKNYIDPLLRKCVGRHYNTGPIGYLIMVGGEALNHHLSPDARVITSDYDLKFVVTPNFTDTDENLRRANVKRLYMLKDLFNCLKSVEPPAGFYDFYPRMTVLFKDVIQDLEIDGHKVYMVNPQTGQKTPFVYRFNKVFTIKMVYKEKENSEPVEFTLIDLGLYYRLPDTEPYYNFLSKTIYDTFLKRPFHKGIPMPYVTDENKIRYPTLKYMIVDTFRMILFANDFLEVYKDNQAKVEHFTAKLAGYHRKLKLILQHVIDKEENSGKKANLKLLIDRLYGEMEKTIAAYVPLIPLNALCFREKDKANFTTQLQDYKECNQQYLDNLDNFRNQYQKTLEIIQQI